MILTEEQREILLHTLGVDRPNRAPWRNYYCDRVDSPELEALVTLGAMQRGVTLNEGRDRYYHVTPDGAAAVGVTLPQRK